MLNLYPLKSPLSQYKVLACSTTTTIVLCSVNTPSPYFQQCHFCIISQVQNVQCLKNVQAGLGDFPTRSQQCATGASSINSSNQRISTSFNSTNASRAIVPTTISEARDCRTSKASSMDKNHTSFRSTQIVSKISQ